MSGLRERKKQATRAALSEAALRLAVERGPDNVRVDDIAEAAGVSPRTYNNYFPSREDAIVFAVTAQREERVAAAVRATSAPLAEAVLDAVVTEYTAPARDTLLFITTTPALRTAYTRTATALEPPLAAALAPRVTDPTTARVLAAGVAAAVRIALEQWAQPKGNTGFVVVSGSLPDLLRSALAPLEPALTAAEA
ncbi:TetR/AcrR family transcriptional regulator [Amycolatopsis sp. FDAARGOS 1241]|uniref:TetR/AcrR family transcriptional regulator n=1 Tax=Amycolatopsis sp. FDAARGOS 1241 TaxID=2778070 RepID=UPI00194E5977|nr:TetR/AcrR family transcriptional regulator [Amycolatopsis sp. FDAARGOS 1241]QRP45506.1 TetR family transcriptional regulator [Amycolatopsis sp. FDAARGOS 1241]